MKRITSTFLILATLLLTGCSNDDVIIGNESQNDNESNQITSVSPSVKAITKYIARQHGVKSRSAGSVLTPYIVNGDTVMYIANYGEGWEVFSNDPRVPMVLMKSDRGSFYPTSLDSDSPFEELFQNTAKYLSMVKKSEIEPTDTINSEWMACGLRTLGNDWEDDGSGTGNNSYYWKLVGMTMPEYSYDIYEPAGGRLKTRWHQEYPYNIYTPVQTNGLHSFVGCVAIALGQYFYFTHYKDNNPAETVTRAQYNGTSNTYTFSELSSTKWELFSTIENNGNDHLFTPIFLGWIGATIEMDYGEKESSSSLLNRIVLDFFNSQTQLNASVEEYTKEYAVELLSKGYPVIIQAEYSNINKGHAWLIDHYESEICTYSEYYIYVNESTEPAPNPNEEEDEEDDLWSHPSVERIKEVYGNVNIDIRPQISNASYYYKFNWGDVGLHNNVKYNANIVSWNHNDSILNTAPYIYYFK